MAEKRITRERQLEQARGRLKQMIDRYIQAEAEVRALEEGFFRVVIFGSARIDANDEAYRMIYRIAYALAERGIDIVTGGGPGLMEAANSAVQAGREHTGRSYGLPIIIPSLHEVINRHLDIKSSHQRFTSRLDEFMRLSNAVVVAPGGIGTMLELLYLWQLLQVGLSNDRPVILFGRDIWQGLLDWMRDVLLAHGYISPSDFRWVTLVDTEAEVIELLTIAHEQFLRMQPAHVLDDQELDTAVTADVMMAAEQPEGKDG